MRYKIGVVWPWHVLTLVSTVFFAGFLILSVAILPEFNSLVVALGIFGFLFALSVWY